MSTGVNVSRLTARDWEHGLITGNGRQGAVLYGDPTGLHAVFSHERLFLPVDEPLAPPDTGSVLEHLRTLCLDGAFQRAADEVVELAQAQDVRYGSLRQADPFIGASTLSFTPFLPIAGPAWRRSVDHRTGEVSQGAEGFLQSAFVSRVDDVVVIRLRGDVAGRLQLAPLAGAPPSPIQHAVGVADGRLWVSGAFGRRWRGSAQGYVTAARVVANGPLMPDGIHLSGEGLVLVRTVVSDDPLDPLMVLASLDDLVADYDALLAPHLAAHGTLFDRCTLRLASSRNPEQPIEDLMAGPPGADLIERLFDAGRYAIISAVGDLPPNLQGVWSGTYEPAWRASFTLDGNLACALSGLGPTGTPELLSSLANLIEAHLAAFRDNADRLYRSDGVLVPPHLTTHGRHNHFGNRWCLTFWTAGAAWVARMLYDHWRYTGDRDFLATRAWPFMVEAAAFARSFLGDGTVFVPSYSPENSPVASDEGPQASINATMDVATTRDLLRNLVVAARELGLTEQPWWSELLDRLPPYQVGTDGSLAEWLWPGLPDNHAHRHASHLYGLWYEPDPVLLDDPALRAAAATAIRRRLDWWAEAGDEMAFGLVHLGLAAATLGLADEAYDVVQRLASRYWRANLVSTHNAGEIFNTDICGGFPALIVAMLVRGQDDHVVLLPALPLAAWPSGSITGVVLRGGIRVESLAWSPSGVTVRLRCATTRLVAVSFCGAERVQSVGVDIVELGFPWDSR